jgi:hypothetical protein
MIYFKIVFCPMEPWDYVCFRSLSHYCPASAYSTKMSENRGVGEENGGDGLRKRKLEDTNPECGEKPQIRKKGSAANRQEEANNATAG